MLGSDDTVKVFVTGATGVMGRSVVAALQDAGHDLVALARRDESAAMLAALDVPFVRGNVFDQPTLTEAMEGCDVVANLATHIPVGPSGIRPGSWKANDRIHVEGSRAVASAAADAGVRRIVQQSVSSVYADHGNEWIDETSAVAVSCAAEPVVLAETHAQHFASSARDAVVLRLGSIVGDDASTRWRLSRAKVGHAVGIGRPQSWIHVVHPDDIGGAVLAALEAPGGTYNVGAEPVRRAELVAAFAEATGHDRASFYRSLTLRLGSDRLEWLTRSQRVSSDKLARATGWQPVRPRFDASWLTAVAPEVAHG